MSEHILTKKCGHTDIERQIDESYNGCILCDFERMRFNLSLAEEGLANAMQEIQRKDTALTETHDVWTAETQRRVGFEREVERLSEEIRLMHIENDALVESVLSLRKALGARDNKETLQALRAATEPEKKT